MTHLLHRLAAAALLAGSALAAHADNVQFIGYANGSANINYNIVSTPSPTVGTVGAGGFSTKLNGGATFVSFCIDLYQTLSFGAPIAGYTQVDGSLYPFTNLNADADLSRLFTAYGAVATASSTNSAAFQTAVWEIAYETALVPYNLATGNAQFTGDAAALAQASAWLGALGTLDKVTITALANPTRQDVLFSTPVPEPGTYALLAAGLAALGFTSRKRRAQA